MRSILLASAVMFSVNGFAAGGIATQGIGAPTADLVLDGESGVHKEALDLGVAKSKKAARKAGDGLKLGLSKLGNGISVFAENPFQETKKFVLYVKEGVASKIDSTSLVVEYRDVENQGGDDFDDIDAYRLLWNVKTTPLVKDNLVALEFTVKAENGEDIDLTYAKATVANIMLTKGIDLEVLSYIYSENQELVQDYTNTKQLNLVTLSANDDDVLEKDWSAFGVDIALVASWEIAAAMDADNLKIGEGDVKIDASVCAGASFSKWGWSAIPEYCYEDNNVFGIESDIAQVTFKKQGGAWSIAIGNRQDEVNGQDAGEMNYIRGSWAFMPNPNTGVDPVPHKKN